MITCFIGRKIVMLIERIVIMSKGTTISDVKVKFKVKHFWKSQNDDNCAVDNDEVCVSPDWYQDNGTPICPVCGQDYVYDRTEILVSK